MVSEHASNESSAGSLTLIGGELALDFANTSSGRGWPTHQEHLRSAVNVVDWADHAHVLPPEDAAWMRETARAESEVGQQLLARALELREDIYVVGVRNRGRPAHSARSRAELDARPCALSGEGQSRPVRRPVRLELARSAGLDRGHIGSDIVVGDDDFTAGRLVPNKNVSGRKMRLAVLRRDQEQEPPLVRDGSLRQSRQAKAIRRQGSRRLKPWVLRWLAGTSALLALGGCSPNLETDQARLCRMALPALTQADARLTIVRQQESADGRGVEVDYFERDPGGAGAAHVTRCRFRTPGRPLHSADLTDIQIDGAHSSEASLYFLVRFWLATPEARAADPAPLGDISTLPVLPPQAAYLLQQAINGLPLTAVYALLAAAYSLVYGLVGRINLAFGELAAAGGYAAALGAALTAHGAPALLLAVALIAAVFVAATWGMAASRWVFQPLHRATGQIVLVATIGLALFLQEFLRLTQGSRLQWVSPILNAPFGVARAGDFIVTTAPNALLAAALALVAGGALVALMSLSRFGRDWRAYADDPLGAQMLGVDPSAIFAQTFALASGFAGLAGYVMTMFYGAVGYGYGTTLGLKALVAAILGGIGSIPGAFLGGLLIGAFEAIWSSAFPIDYRDVAIFSLLAILLTLRPGGILGAPESVRR